MGKKKVYFNAHELDNGFVFCGTVDCGEGHKQFNREVNVICSTPEALLRAVADLLNLDPKDV